MSQLTNPTLLGNHLGSADAIPGDGPRSRADPGTTGTRVGCLRRPSASTQRPDGFIDLLAGHRSGLTLTAAILVNTENPLDTGSPDRDLRGHPLSPQALLHQVWVTAKFTNGQGSRSGTEQGRPARSRPRSTVQQRLR